MRQGVNESNFSHPHEHKLCKDRHGEQKQGLLNINVNRNPEKQNTRIQYKPKRSALPLHQLRPHQTPHHHRPVSQRSITTIRN